jgi:hypothetical protein
MDFRAQLDRLLIEQLNTPPSAQKVRCDFTGLRPVTQTLHKPGFRASHREPADHLKNSQPVVRRGMVGHRAL